MITSGEALAEYYDRAFYPKRHCYIVTDEMTMLPGMRLGETIEIVEHPPLGGWPDLPRLWADSCG